MSDEPGDSSGESGQGGGNHPTGGRGGGNQPAGQQPQGANGPPGQQAAYQQGPGIGDIFSRPETVKELKVGLLIYAVISIGLGIGAFGLTTAGGGASMMAAGFVVLLTMLSPFILSAVIAGFLGLRQARELDEEPENLILGTAAVTGFAGTIVMFVVGFVFSMLAAGGSGGGGGGSGAIGQLIVPLLMVCLGAAIAGAGCAWIARNVLAKQPRPRSAPASHQQQ